MKRYGIVLSFLLLCCQISFAQNPSISILDSGHNASLRGLSAVDNEVVWCSGSNGTVARSTDGGKSFEWITVSGYEKRDFRDIEAFDANTAVIMGISEPAVILKTTDAGKTWIKVFEDSTKGMFLDAMSFDEKGSGVVIGDPIDGKVYLAKTNDFGNTWKKESGTIDVEKGESFFASSGTNIHTLHEKENSFVFVSGGMVSRLFYGKRKLYLPLMRGKESTGANSIAMWGKKGIVVGGDFAQDARADSNCVLFSLGKSPDFSIPAAAPKGYKSCVIYLSKKTLVTCGTSGVDISYDGGMNWKNISKQSFHAVQKSKSGRKVFLSGGKGKIATLVLAQ
ncbi:MAG: YCF48-related protein [Bacteroidota bacterium]